MKKKDIIIILIITLIYGIISFINLGDINSPQTFWNVTNQNESIVVEIEENYVAKMRHFSGARFGKYQLYVSSDGENFTFLKDLEQPLVFNWNDLEINYKFKYLKITGVTNNSYLGEIALYDNNNQKINIIATTSQSHLIIDEQNLIPDKINFMNSAYFDEIYHARTAYEYVEGLTVYEWTHPPLGKLIMAIPISLFGMSPFSYRLMGNICGILMIPVIYIIGKDMFKSSKYASLAAVILSLDNFHFAQTRMATIDSYLVLFIMLSFMFMYKYLICSKKVSITKRMFLLFSSGLFFGCSIATKWTGFFAGIGLAILFFAKLINDNVVEKIIINKEKINIEFKEKKWNKEATKITIYCSIFFILIPVLIYIICYIPDINVNSLSDIIKLQVQMYKYHSELSVTHFFSSKWYTWFVMLKPVWYYVNETSRLYSTISGIGNPIIWWTGIIGIMYVLIKSVKLFDKKCLFLIIIIITSLLPYLLINRVMFMYHYFPILPFMILGIVYFIKDFEQATSFKHLHLIYVIIIGLVFIYFYPVVSGINVPKTYIESTQWLDTWYY